MSSSLPDEPGSASERDEWISRMKEAVADGSIWSLVDGQPEPAEMIAASRKRAEAILADPERVQLLTSESGG